MPRLLSPQEAQALELDTTATEPGGSRLLSPQEADALGLNDSERLQAEFGTTGQQILTGLEGAGDTLTLGTSTLAETALGVDPENIAAREKANPTAHVVGEGLGIAAPIILSRGAAALPMGARAVAQGAAELAAPSLISEAGGLASKVAKALLPEASGVAGRVATRAAQGVATGAVEGGLYGTGHVVHEAALGDPNLTAQSAMEEVGLSALLGGGLMGGGSVLSALGKEAVGSGLGKKLSEWLPELEGKAAVKSTFAPPAEIRKLNQRIGADGVAKLGREAEELGISAPFSTPAKIAERADAVMDAAASEQGQLLDKAIASGAKPKPLSDIATRLEKEVIAPLEDNPLREGVANSLRKFVSKWGDRFTEDTVISGSLENPPSGFGLKELHTIRKELDAEIRGLRGAYDPSSSYLKNALYDARTVLAKELDDALSASSLGKEWRSINRKYHVAATVGELAEKGAARQHANNLLSLSGILSALTGFATHGIPGGAALGLGTELAKRFGHGVLARGVGGVRRYLAHEGVRSAVGKTVAAIAQDARAAAGATTIPEAVASISEFERANLSVAKKVDDLVTSVVKGTKAGAVPTALKLSGIGKTTGERAAHIRALAQNPTALQQQLLSSTDGMGDHAPKTQQAMQVATARAVAFLASKAPSVQKTGPLGFELKPSREEEWRFEKYLGAVNQPTSILQHAAQGTLVPQEVEAVKTVYPQLHEAMVQSALRQITESKEPVPYRAKMALAMLMGGDVDGTLTPKAIMGAQAVYQRPSQKAPENQTGPGAMGKPTQAGMSKLKISSRAQTPGQAMESRRDAS